MSNRKLTHYSPKISKCVQIIDANPSISLTELSDQIQTNKSYLCRLFKKKEVKINLTDYTLNVRIEKKAKVLLVETGLKVNDISQKLGYIYPTNSAKILKELRILSQRIIVVSINYSLLRVNHHLDLVTKIKILIVKGILIYT